MNTYEYTVKLVDRAGHGRFEEHSVPAGTFGAAVREAARVAVQGRDLDDITSVTITVHRPVKK